MRDELFDVSSVMKNSLSDVKRSSESSREILRKVSVDLLLERECERRFEELLAGEREWECERWLFLDLAVEEGVEGSRLPRDTDKAMGRDERPLLEEFACCDADEAMGRDERTLGEEWCVDSAAFCSSGIDEGDREPDFPLRERRRVFCFESRGGGDRRRGGVTGAEDDIARTGGSSVASALHGNMPDIRTCSRITHITH